MHPCRMLLLFGCLLLSPQVTAGGERYNFNIPPGSASQALQRFALQADVQLLYPSEEVKTIRVPGLKGRFTTREGIRRLLLGTPLVVVSTEQDNLVIRRNDNNRRGNTMSDHNPGQNRISTFSKNLLAVLVAAVASGSHAQDDSDTQARGSVLMEEVVVTARKKAVGESIQDTAIAITAFDERQFKAVFADDLADLGNLAPNVEMKQAGQVGVQNFTIRGMGVSGTTPSDSPAVGVFQNGVFWGTNYGSLLDTFDIESVEILRGPQGTLFGRNVTGGAVVVRTKRPGDEFDMAAEVLVGDYGRRDYSVAVEGPLTDTLSGRFVVLDRNLDGYFDNIFTGDDYGESDTTLLRGTLVWQVTDNFDATLILEDYDEDGNSIAAVGIEVPGNLPYTEVGFRQPDDWWDIRLDNPGTAENEVESAVLEMNWDLGHGVLTSITGYRAVEVNHNTDFDASEFSGFNRSLWMDQDQFSEEIRYASTFSDTLEFTLGAYYFEQEQDYREGRDINQNANVFAAGSFLDQSSWALFGELDYTITPEWVLTVGGRYTSETIKAQTVPFGTCPLDPTIPDPFRIRDLSLPCDLGPTGDEDWGDFSPKLGLTWTPDDQNLVYGSVTKGFRSGGFSMRGNNLLPPFDAEEVTAYEIGYKGDLIDRRLRLNIALFYNDYQDLQRTSLVPTGDGTGVTQSTGNAAEATVQGAEVEVTLQAADNLVFTLGYGYTDASFDEYRGFDVTGDGVPDPQLARNLDFTRVPENTASASVNYSMGLGALGDLDFRAAISYTDEVYFDDRNTILEPSYSTWDASVTYHDPTDHWSVALFGKNLGEEEYAYWGTSLGALGQNRFVGAPRTVGLRVSYDY